MSDQPVFPTFDLEGREFSKLLLGHNPFLGGSYMSQARTRLYQETFDDSTAMERIISYLWDDEEKHWRESRGCCEQHIFSSIAAVRKWLDGNTQ